MTARIALTITASLILLSGCAPQPPAETSAPTVKPTVAALPTAEPQPDDTWSPPPTGEVVAADELRARLPGYWTGDWGDIVFRIEDDGTVVGAYLWDEGMVIGKLVDDVLVGWWCEVPSRQPDVDAGDVEMRLVQDGSGTHIDGRWSYGQAGGTWNDNWDIDAISEDEPPADLVARLDRVTTECIPH